MNQPPVEPPATPWQLPSPDLADESGLVGVGADLEPGTLLAAYRHGLFPMPFRKGQIGWWSPDPRGILPLDGLIVSRSLRSSQRRFEIRIDTAFTEVMRRCGDPARPHGWINDAFIDWSGNCGNLSSAVGPFAIANGFIDAARIPQNGMVTVRIWQANIHKTIVAHVQVTNGEVQETGDFELDGVTFPAAEVQLEFIDPAAEEDGAGGSMFPTGNLVDELEVPGVGTLEATMINAGISGNTTPAGLARMDRDVLAHKPQLVTIMFGMNDVTGIPPEAYDYIVNGKPALDWVIERQGVRTDKDSGIVNDANAWASETLHNPRYPLELFLRVITVSLETLKIVRALPALDVIQP